MRPPQEQIRRTLAKLENILFADILTTAARRPPEAEETIRRAATKTGNARTHFSAELLLAAHVQ